MALACTATRPDPLCKAESLLRLLQDALEEATESCGTGAHASALAEGKYLDFCCLTGGIHEQLNVAKEQRENFEVRRYTIQKNARRSHQGGDWHTRTCRPQPDGSILVEERGRRRQVLGEADWGGTIL